MVSLVLVLSLTLADASADNPKYAPPAVAAAQARLERAGSVLGAASLCPEIDRERLRAAADKMTALIDKGVDDNSQYYAAHNIFDKGIDSGKAGIRTHANDCRRAAADLSALEKELGP
ncbi:MAG TPA: hypothetical protein VLX85_10210 [Stellaceae bacterium]|nr:hypothetical protein [Stellaceae bacterium]